MEFWTAVRVLVRRWYVVVPCVIAVAVVGAVVVGNAKPSYRATGSLVALRDSQPAASTDGKAVPINPWQTADYSSNLFAMLMAQAATDQAFTDGLADEGVDDYTVVGPADQSSTLHVEVVADTPEEALAQYRLVVEALRADARWRQESSGAPEVTWVSLLEVTVPIRAEKLNNAKVVAAILIVAVGALGTLGLTFLFDAVASARAHRSGTRRGVRPGPDPIEPDGQITGGRGPAPILTVDELVDLSDVHDDDDQPVAVTGGPTDRATSGPAIGTDGFDDAAFSRDR